MSVWQIDLTFEEPPTFGETPAVGNEVSTLDYVPATALRGALAAALLRVAGRRREARMAAWFSGPRPRWTPAFPVLTDCRYLCVPAPLCLYEEKSGGPFLALNELRLNLPGTVAEYGKEFSSPEGYGGEERLDWVRARRRWLAVSRDGEPAYLAALSRGSSLHVALHYARQSHRQGQLFSRSAIDPGEDVYAFRAFVDDPESVIQLDEMPSRVFLGKRRSAGNGAATVKWQAPDALYARLNRPPLGDATLVQLMSDTIVPGTGGGFLKMPPGAEVIASDHQVYPGWSTAWGLPREAVVAIAAGSVFRMSSAHAKLAATEGIGIRTHEGFGWAVMNPPWLDEPDIRRGADMKPLEDKNPPEEWPGCQGPAERLRALNRGARETARRVRPQHLTALSAYAGRVDQTGEVIAYLERMAARANRREWDKTRDAVAPVLRDILERDEPDRRIDRARFFLEAAVTYAGPSD